MTLEQLYKKVVEIGMEADPRSSEQIERFLKSKKEEFKKLKTKEEKELHGDRTWNPYDDTRIIFGAADRTIRTIFVGIDVGPSELLLIDRLNAQRKAEGKPLIDAAMGHHPEGYALGGLACVMDDIHVEILRQAGVPVNVAEKINASRIRDVHVSIQSANLHRPMEYAKLLDIPLICCHTVADNSAYQTIKRVVEKAKPYLLKDIVDAMMKIPCYKKASALFDKPVSIAVGSPESRAGKIIIGGFTGGTEGNPEVLEFAVNTAGVGTTIQMHMTLKHRELSEKFRLNTIIGNHMASDSIGMQPIVDFMRKEGLEVVTGSGYIDAPLP